MDQIRKTNEELESYKSTVGDFTDYLYFEDDSKRRAVERYSFIHNREYVPVYKYPKLDFLIDNQDISDKKANIQESIMELEASKDYPNVNIAETELYASFYETRLKRIMLVEAARNLSNPIMSDDYEINRISFAKLNEELYGEMNESYYLGIIKTEKDRLLNFHPKSDIEANIKSELELSLGHFDTKGENEKELMDGPSMNKLHNYIQKRYGKILDVVPDTPDDIYYGVEQCVEIMNKALAAAGLSDLGWTAVENSQKTAVSTLTSKKTINLPSNTRRNANELRRLIMHEQEVHARRGQNGTNTGIKLLKLGTADYADIEEGLGVMMECAVAGKLDNPSFDRARNRYLTAGLALGVNGKPRDARETYEILWRTLAMQKADHINLTAEDLVSAKDSAYTLVENAYRGTQFWMQGVIYTKLKVYYEGLVKNAEYFNEHIDTLDSVFDDLFIGKYNHTDREEKALVKKAILDKNS